MPKSASELYRGLECHKHGIPQFTPEPNQNLPHEYQKVGVSIGDVGIWHDGSFDVLFNTCRPPSHSINGAHGVPENFSVFPLHSRDISQRPYHSPGSIIASTKVSQVALNVGASSAVNPFFPTTVGSSMRFKFESEEGAILVLPKGASRQDLLPIKTMWAHARKCSPQWYRYAQEHNGPLFVVTGCDKTASWAIATASTTTGAIGISVKFAVVGVAEGTLAPRYQWKDFGSATVRTSGENSTGAENQCIFIRGFFVPRKIPLITFVTNKILLRRRELEGALAQRRYNGLEGYRERTRVLTTQSISILQAGSGGAGKNENKQVTAKEEGDKNEVGGPQHRSTQHG